MILTLRLLHPYVTLHLIFEVPSPFRHSKNQRLLFQTKASIPLATKTLEHHLTDLDQ